MSRLTTRIPLGHIPKKRTRWCLNWRHILNGLESTTPWPRSGFYFALKSYCNCFLFFLFSSPAWCSCSSVLYYKGFCDFFYRSISPQRSIRILRCWIFCAWLLNCRSWCTSRVLVRTELANDHFISTEGFVFKVVALMSQLFKGW